MTAVLTWAEWLWAGVPMFFVGWFLHDVVRERQDR